MIVGIIRSIFISQTGHLKFNSLLNHCFPGEMPYTCELCSKTFTFQQSYHKHLLYHTDEKKHTCTICGRAFKELSTLHNHERIHSGEKPYKCETCGMLNQFVHST